MPKNSHLASEARNFKAGFERLLKEATNLANGNVSHEALESNQFVTRYTMEAEKLTCFYTGIPFDINLTNRQMMLTPINSFCPVNEHAVDSLNRRAYKLTAELADFKDRLLQNVLACNIFTVNYPLLIEHILREARFFMDMLDTLNKRRGIVGSYDIINQEVFWNRQMAEHAKFIAGLLDPTEETLIEAARMFGQEFDKLTAESKIATQRANGANEATNDSIAAMKRLQEFKTAGTQGLLECSIRSIIIPLLADHVLREANHYLCVLGVCNID